MGASQESNLFRKGKVWGVRIKLPVCYSKHEYKRLIGSKAAAIEDRDRVKRLIRLRQPLDESPAAAVGHTLEHYLREAARAWKTGDARRSYIEPWISWGGQVPISHITRPRLQEAANQMEEEGYAAATIRLAVAALKAAFALAEDMGQLQSNPLARPLKLPIPNKRKKYVPVDALWRLIAIMGPYGVMAEFAVISGLRCSEMLGLSWPHISEAYLEIPKTKQGPAHAVFLVPRLREILRLQMGKHPTWVFPSPMGKRWQYSVWSRRRREWFAEAGLEGFVWHDLRHTAASYAISSGEPLAAIGAHLGQNDARTTERYAHMLPDPAQRVPGTIAAYLYSARAEA